MRQTVRPGRDGNGLLYPTLCLVAGKRQICCKPTFNVYCVRPQHIWRRSTVFEFLFRGRIIPVVLVADIMCLLCATTREASRVKVYCMLQLSYWPLAGMCGCGEVIRKCKLFKESWWRKSLCLLDAKPWPGNWSVLEAPASIPGMSTVGDNDLNFASSVILAALCLLYAIPSAS